MTTHQKPEGRGCAYLRVSSSKQEEVSQREAIGRWLAEKDLTVDRWYTDVGPRDQADRRPQFQQMLQDIADGQYRWVLVSSKDRFGTRDSYQFGKYISLLIECDCQLWSASQGLLSGDDDLTAVMNTIDSLRSRDEQKTRATKSINGKIAGTRRGEWQGGVPPYGFDVMCIGRDGLSKWRLVYVGKHERLKIMPDGQEHPYNGRHHAPSHDKGDHLVLVPSRDQQRVEVVKTIFRTLATESISLRGLCTRLNDLGISPIYSSHWYSSYLGLLVRNPTYYLGAGVWNRRGKGRFLEWDGSGQRPVPRNKGKAHSHRPREESAYILPDRPAEGLVDKALWDQVQQKLKGLRPPARAPRNPRLWLVGFLTCARCGKNMVAWHQKGNKTMPDSYTCATYRTFGRNNPTACRLHTVNRKIIEALIDRYLQESGQHLQAVLATEDEAGLARLRAEADQRIERYRQALRAVSTFVRATGPVPLQEVVEVDGQSYEVMPPPSQVYRERFEKERPRLERRLAEKEAELGRLVERFAVITGKLALEKAQTLMQAVEREIIELRKQLVPLDEWLDEARAEMRQGLDAVADARTSLRGESNRVKAESLGRVLNRIVCHFRHEDVGSRRLSVLEAVDFQPLDGEAIILRPESRSPRACR